MQGEKDSFVPKTNTLPVCVVRGTSRAQHSQVEDMRNSSATASALEQQREGALKVMQAGVGKGGL